MLRDPLFRRLVSSSAFAAIFIWVAVRYYNVETGVMWVFLGLSFLFVGILVVIGLLLAPAVRIFRRKPLLLSKLDVPSSDETQSSSQEAQSREKKS